jgi:biopolymer transport protein ExbD
MADFTLQESGNTRKKQYHLQKAGVRIDMTPMVDVIMLLLTFFMLTTTLAMPQVMQINLPKGDDPVKVNMGNILNVRVSDKGNIFFSQGLENGSEASPEKISFANMRNKLEEMSKTNPNLLLLLMFDRNMKYTTMVDILDEINNADIEKRYSFKKMGEKDKEIVMKAEK